MNSYENKSLSPSEEGDIVLTAVLNKNGKPKKVEINGEPINLSNLL
jgi:hypothetical protein